MVCTRIRNSYMILNFTSEIASATSCAQPIRNRQDCYSRRRQRNKLARALSDEFTLSNAQPHSVLACRSRTFQEKRPVQSALYVLMFSFFFLSFFVLKSCSLRETCHTTQEATFLANTSCVLDAISLLLY